MWIADDLHGLAKCFSFEDDEEVDGVTVEPFGSPAPVVVMDEEAVEVSHKDCAIGEAGSSVATLGEDRCKPGVSRSVDVVLSPGCVFAHDRFLLGGSRAKVRKKSASSSWLISSRAASVSISFAMVVMVRRFPAACSQSVLMSDGVMSLGAPA